jgi:hypothetical protein
LQRRRPGSRLLCVIRESLDWIDALTLLGATELTADVVSATLPVLLKTPDRALFRDALGFKSVGAGHGWLIFVPPPGEAAVHPSDESSSKELYFMCEDLNAEMASLAKKGVKGV